MVETDIGYQLLTELAMATDQLLQAEDIIAIEPDWPLIDSDLSVAVSVRKMLTRRKRWALDYDRLMGIVRRILVTGYTDFLNALPDRSGKDADEAPAFTVPLVSLVDDPKGTIERLFLSFYDDDVFRYDLFHHLRGRLGTNLVVASGFPPETNPHDVQFRLVMPSRHRSANPTELADLYFGGTPYADVLSYPVPFSIPYETRFEHCHIVGGTGHGKTQLMQRMIYDDLAAARDDGRSVVVIDSQGDLIQKLLRLDLFAPEQYDSLFHRLVLIDPADIEHPPALNLFDAHTERLADYGPADRERALNGVIELYETFFGALLGAELTQRQGVIFRYLARLMLAIPGATIHTLMQLMEDGRPYQPHMRALGGAAGHFFDSEFFHPSFAATKKQILKRLWGVLSTPAFERMFAQRENKVDLFDAMQGGKIILINTAKDLLKTEGSALFGRFFIAMLAQAALERSAVPGDERTPCFVYVDEAQEYFDDNIETILSQARKYRVGMTLAHQALDQLSPRLRSAFLSNTSFKCAGGISHKDAHALAGELHTTPEFIQAMKRRGGKSEFAAWLKHRTPEALRLSVELGFLERRPTLTDDDYDLLIDESREKYCGTSAEVLAWPKAMPAAEPRVAPSRAPEPTLTDELVVAPPKMREPPEDRELGKGGPKHRYLQNLVKELAGAQGFRATVEAPLSSSAGQVDVLLNRDGLRVAVEISVTTSAEHECDNVLKCLAEGYDRVVLLMSKSAAVQARYRQAIEGAVASDDLARLSFLSPEDVPDFIASLAPPPGASETTVRGYRVKVLRTAISPEEAQARRERLTKLVARSLRDNGHSPA